MSESVLFTIIIVAIAIGVILLPILARMFRGSTVKGSGALTKADMEKLVLQWNKAQELVSLGKPSQVKEAVLTADKIVDYSLRKIYPNIEVSVERYKMAKEFFAEKKDYDDLWFAHKVRNEIVHNLDFELPYAEGVKVIEKYRKSLKIIGVLL